MTWLDEYIMAVQHTEATVIPVNDNATAKLAAAEIDQIPMNVLPEPLRSFYRSRAMAGHDVEAYYMPLFSVWTIWDTTIRVRFSDKPPTWVITSALSIDHHHWSICLRQISDNTPLQVLHSYECTPVNAMRRIVAYVQHCNVTGESPTNN